MSLIKSISGIRGTIGGTKEEGLNPLSIAKFVTAYVAFIKESSGIKSPRIVVGRDARISGPMVKKIVVGTLMAVGSDVIDIDLATTPTTELAVTHYKADGGIIITASHNPKHWNALKLLDSRGEFLSDAQGKRVLEIADKEDFSFAEVDEIGEIVVNEDFTDEHIKMVLDLPIVDVEAVKNAGFKVAVDAVNSVGGIAIPRLLKALGVKEIAPLNVDPTGHFAHNPEPLPKHLTDICKKVKDDHCDLGVVVDPDVDRLALVDENGNFFGEEYTLVAVADYVLSVSGKGNTVSNLSSSRALRDITEKHGGTYSAAAVGEVNVVTEMKRTGALIGGEGNGGVIYPAIHYGRDALVGVAIILTMMAKRKETLSQIRKSLPEYFMSKQRVDTPEGTDTKKVLATFAEAMKEHKPTTIDGVKIDFADSWVHIRRSNTEPIIRVYTEAPTQKEADDLALSFVEKIKGLLL